MARKRNKKRRRPIDFDEVGKTVAKLLEVKRRLILSCMQSGDDAFARLTLERAHDYIQTIWEGLEIELCEGGVLEVSPRRRLSRRFMAAISSKRVLSSMPSALSDLVDAGRPGHQLKDRSMSRGRRLAREKVRAPLVLGSNPCVAS